MEASAVQLEMSEYDPKCMQGRGEGTRIRAARLLDAWIAGDRQRLDYELSQWRDGDLAAEGADGREELLLTVVKQMMSEPDLYASRDDKLHLGVWIDMLAHLSEQD